MTDHNNLAAQEQKADHDEGRLPVPMVCTSSAREDGEQDQPHACSGRKVVGGWVDAGRTGPDLLALPSNLGTPGVAPGTITLRLQRYYVPNRLSLHLMNDKRSTLHTQ